MRRIADSELGFQQVKLSSPGAAKIYLFINSDKMVVGCLVAEPIRQVCARVLVMLTSTSVSDIFPYVPVSYYYFLVT